MFQNTELSYILLPAIIVGFLVIIITNYRRSKRNTSAMNKAIEQFEITCIIAGALLTILWFSLPSNATLQTFYYPADAVAINSEDKILLLFQKYNKAIVRTNEVLKWFLFLFIWWFLATLSTIIKYLRRDS